MKRLNFTLCTIKGVPFEINSTWTLFMLIMLFVSPHTLPFWGLLYLSVFLHELGHFIPAITTSGIEVKKVSIHILGGGVHIKNMSDIGNLKEFYVTIGGVIVTCALVCIGTYFGWELFIGINILLFAFNVLLPLYPFDGGRLLKCIIGFIGFGSKKQQQIIFLWNKGLAGFALIPSIMFNLPVLGVVCIIALLVPRSIYDFRSTKETLEK